MNVAPQDLWVQQTPTKPSSTRRLKTVSPERRGRDFPDASVIKMKRRNSTDCVTRKVPKTPKTPRTPRTPKTPKTPKNRDDNEKKVLTEPDSPSPLSPPHGTTPRRKSALAGREKAKRRSQPRKLLLVHKKLDSLDNSNATDPTQTSRSTCRSGNLSRAAPLRTISARSTSTERRAPSRRASLSSPPVRRTSREDLDELFSFERQEPEKDEVTDADFAELFGADSRSTFQKSISSKQTGEFADVFHGDEAKPSLRSILNAKEKLKQIKVKAKTHSSSKSTGKSHPTKSPKPPKTPTGQRNSQQSKMKSCFGSTGSTSMETFGDNIFSPAKTANPYYVAHTPKKTQGPSFQEFFDSQRSPFSDDASTVDDESTVFGMFSKQEQ